MKVRSIIFIFIFSVLTAIPLIFFTPRKTVSESENRMLSVLDFSAAPGVFDKTGVFENWFSDHLGFRDEMFRYTMGAKYHLFGIINYLNMIEGSDGEWYSMDLYQQMEYTGVDSLMTDERLAADVAGLTAVGEWMKAQGTPFIIMINPDKDEVSDENLPPVFVRNTTDCRGDKIARLLREGTSIPVVLSKEAMQNYDGRYGYPLFWESYDVTHWCYPGAFVAYESLMDTLCEIKPVPVLTFEDANFYDETFDTSFIWGIKWCDTVPTWHIDNSMIKSDNDVPDDVPINFEYYHFHNPNLEDEGTSLLIAGDSYTQEYLIDLLKHSYTDVYFVISYLDRAAVPALVTAVHPDVVVFEWASRMYPMMDEGFSEGWGI